MAGMLAGDFLRILDTLREWDEGGAYGRSHMLADGEPAWLLAWREQQSQR